MRDARKTLWGVRVARRARDGGHARAERREMALYMCQFIFV